MRAFPVLCAVCLGLAVPPSPSPAQEAPRLAGTVVAAGSGEPVVGASVVVQSARDSAALGGALTGERGRFLVERVPSGTYTVRITHLGYGPVTRTVAVAPDAGTLDLGTLEMVPAAIEVEGVEVSAERSQMVIASDRTLYRTEDMPAVAGGTATDVLRSVPELEVDVDGNVSLRGTQSVTVHVNGRPSPLQGEALRNFLRQLPADRIERVEVIPNPSARYDPEGLAGILNIVLKQGTSIGLGGSVSLSAGSRGDVGGSGQIAWQRGRLSVFGNASRNTHRSENAYSAVRQNLLVEPRTSTSQDGTGKNDGSFDMLDLSAELQATGRILLWTSLRAMGNRSGSDALMEYALQTPEQLLERYDAHDRTEWSHGASDVSIGARHAVEPERNQISIELRRSGSDGGQEHWRTREILAAGGGAVVLPPEESWLDADEGDERTSLQADYVRPVGGTGKLEAGYRGALQGSDHEDERIGDPSSAGQSAFAYRERFHSGYLTLGGQFGRLSAQAGVRGETADTELELPITAERFTNDYTSLFPSANLALDLGSGRQARLAYSKRIQRPWVWILNPTSSSLDPLNRFEGNPYLDPKFTHSWSLDLSWSGSMGTLTASPYFRRTVDNWDQVVRVDGEAFVTTWDNVGALDAYGSTLTASLRPSGRLSGFASLSAAREDWEASGLTGAHPGDGLRWSGNVSASVRGTPDLSLQLMARYSAPRTMPQGTMGATTMTSFGARQQLLDQKLSVSLSVTDPFDVYRFRYETRDRTHLSTSRSDVSIRSVRLSLNYAFGRPPRQSRPRGEPEAGAEPPRPGGGG